MPNFLLTMWDTLNSSNIGMLVAAGLGMFAVIGGLAMLSYHYTLGSIKSRTVGDGQHGTARWQRTKRSARPMPMYRSRSESGETVKLSPRSKGWCWAARARKMKSRHW